MDAALLVANQDVGQVGGLGVTLEVLEFGLQQCLADPRDVAVAEDPEAARDQALLDTIARNFTTAWATVRRTVWVINDSSIEL